MSAADLDAAAVQRFVGSVESTIVHYGKSTGFFAEKMTARGPGYLSAAVLYENLVIESYAASTSPPMVALYPVEGTFWADHPYCILDADWVGPEQREAAEALLAFLRSRPAQERALSLGFRPSDPQIPLGAPIDPAHGVDPKQPQTLLEVPDAAVLEKLLRVWGQNKKATDVVVAFDKSGSMQGRPLAEAKAGARAFVQSLHDADEATLLLFDGTVYPPIGPVRIGQGRQSLLEAIDNVIADDGTALYEAISKAYELAREHARASPEKIHAVLVMTDGKDESRRLVTLPQLTSQLSGEGSTVKVFTIAYGSQADAKVLDSIAEAAKGSSAQGTQSNIVQVYQDMASFF
jgi:Ca-activated chloride channel homolog